MPMTDDEVALETAKSNYSEAARRLAEMLEVVALGAVKHLFPAAHMITVKGSHGEEGEPRLRLQVILDADANVLWSGDNPADDAVEDAISAIDMEYLDWLIDITGDEWFGQHDLDGRRVAADPNLCGECGKQIHESEPGVYAHDTEVGEAEDHEAYPETDEDEELRRP